MGDRVATLEVVQRLTLTWSRMTEERDFPLRPDHCINGSRVGVDVLRHFGVRARPVSVGLALFNRQAWELYINGYEPAQWPEHAWSIGIAPGVPVPGSEDGWPGHLVVEGDGWTMDLSAQQFARPGRIDMPNALWFNQRIKDDGDSIFIDSRQQVLSLWRAPSNAGWKQARGWLHTEINRALIDECITRMHRDEEEGNPDGRRDE